MKTETRSAHITPINGNIFKDLGFGPKQAADMKVRSDRIISEQLVIKHSLMENPTEFKDWGTRANQRKA
ncbi:hypothetical protein [Duganella qianjiadongensis]|uniref:Uncharacterized protein n=1 Tax=Duganella qianjiadongensis TaxID=2692176 RepID=A0ABW9VT12_9BURK|nr:hypothetical protein [Duganella qianjiadongensis]MYM42223.1 hypothetical protein [Duganella qianjiadongensis]